MNKVVSQACALLLIFGSRTFLSAQQARPLITGISHMCLYAHDLAASDDFYARILGATKGADPQDPRGVRYYFSPAQFVEVLPLPADAGISRMGCVAYSTSDVVAMHRYLAAHSVTGLSEVLTASDGSRWFHLSDPENNTVQFMATPAARAAAAPGKPISKRIIHVGYMVHDRAKEDAFYKDVLGFRPYWFGAMQPGRIDWIAQQVPDGHDWMEYMMAGDDSTSRQGTIDARQLGVMNHFSLGVKNMEEAVTVLMREDRLSPRHDGPQMGKDGKWQANFYDPDGTRVELMEFQPVMKPCCSDFTAASPASE